MDHQLTFDYLIPYDTGKDGITLGVTLKPAQQTTSLEAKIDTGASCCIFEYQHGKTLGLDVESGWQQFFSTATGKFLAYGHHVTLSVWNLEFEAVVYFAANEGFNRNVLGRNGFLQQVRLGLVDYEGKLYLSRYDDEQAVKSSALELFTDVTQKG